MGTFALTILVHFAWPSLAPSAVEDLRAEAVYQTKLPVAAAPASETEDVPKLEPQRWTGPSQTTESISSALLWVVIGVAALFLLVVVGREFAQRTPAAVTPKPTDEPTMVLHVSAATLDEAETLAQSGDLAAAIHVLLLRTFTDISRQAILPDALTSREVLARVHMADEARAALTRLVMAVEVSLFGDTTPTAEDYTHCRASFDQLRHVRGIELR